MAMPAEHTAAASSERQSGAACGLWLTIPVMLPDILKAKASAGTTLAYITGKMGSIDNISFWYVRYSQNMNVPSLGIMHALQD